MEEQLLKYITGELPVDELMKLFQRIDNDESLKEEFVRLHNLSAVSKLLPLPTDRDEGIKNYALFASQMTRRTRKARVINILKYAAIAVALVASTVWTTLFLQDRKMDSTMNTLYVPAGQRAQITLQDGTEVWLNAQSTLTYPSHFSRKSREVEVTGEAFFDVTKNKAPFIVTTQNIELLVLGTQFNLYSYPDAGYIQTDLVEGSVKIYETLNEKNGIVLKSNEQAIIRNNRMTIGKILHPDHLLWRKGIYSFENEPLIDIIEKLELYYDITIRVEDPEIFNVRYTGKFRQNDGIIEILNILQKIQAFKIEKDRDKNIITLTK